MTITTRPQREALFRVFQRDFPGWVTPYKRVDRNGREIRVPSIHIGASESLLIQALTVAAVSCYHGKVCGWELKLTAILTLEGDRLC